MNSVIFRIEFQKNRTKNSGGVCVRVSEKNDRKTNIDKTFGRHLARFSVTNILGNPSRSLTGTTEKIMRKHRKKFLVYYKKMLWNKFMDFFKFAMNF